MWPYSWTHVGTPSYLGHMDQVAATMAFQAHAGAAQEAPNIGQWEGQDVPLVRSPSCIVKGGIPSSRRYLSTYPVYPANEWRLVPLGHLNWKWNQARSNYSTYDQEVLPAMLLSSSQSRLLGNNPIVWLCHQEPVKTFQKGPPPEKAKIKFSFSSR